MEIFEYLIYFIISFLAFGVLGISYLIFRFIKQKSKRRWLQVLAIIPVAIFSFLIYRIYVPGDSYYKEHYELTTGLEFPKNGKIHIGQVSDVDEFGDGIYFIIAEVGRNQIDQLHEILIGKKYEELEEPNQYVKAKEYPKLITEYSLHKPGRHVDFGIMDDSTTILIQIINW